jgi:hypothetical protein
MPMTFEGIQVADRSAARARRDEHLTVVGAPALIAGWSALSLWCIQLLGGLAALSPPSIAPRQDAALSNVSHSLRVLSFTPGALSRRPARLDLCRLLDDDPRLGIWGDVKVAGEAGGPWSPLW